MNYVYLEDLMITVFNDGEILNPKGKRLPHVSCKLGYQRVYYAHPVTKKRMQIFVHRAVAIAFIENPFNKPDVNHKDGNKGNNHASNLEWVTKSENIQHAIKSGLFKPHTGCVYPERNARIKEQIRSGEKTIKQIASEYGMTDGRVRQILNDVKLNKKYIRKLSNTKAA